METSDPPDRVVVIGGGIAGLATALHLASLPVTLLVASPLGQQASTALAQGGIAAALGPRDHPDLHASDTLQAGGGLSDPSVADRVTAAAASCIKWLITQGVPFDRSFSRGDLALGLEAAHSRRRIVHAGGDSTGSNILDTLICNVRAIPVIEIHENIRVTDLAIDHHGAVTGVFCTSSGSDRSPQQIFMPTRAVVLATGGIGGLYAHTTNPLGATGSGLALAARAGAILRDIEFVQFHPTAIATARDPMPLATEALRGEGAVLINGKGERFLDGTPGAELAPRDIVARAIFAQIEAGETVYLDTRASLGDRLPSRFPNVAALCRSAGIDPVRDPIPVRPAAHYHMGGIKVNECGRSSIDGLWACGEVASTGLHGANRLASNSLLEALAFARWIADDIRSMDAKAARPVSLPFTRPDTNVRSGANVMPPLDAIRASMDRHVGVLRSAAGLANAMRYFRPFIGSRTAYAGSPAHDAALIGLLIATAALMRQESRGSHQRRDYPTAAADIGQHAEITLDQALHVTLDADEQNGPPLTRKFA
ncbi:L-aspartate oxidase [Microvirga sp. 2TAF3]|uniref:L-aspartate oxidase n=1 Tax=Microvirga sp. 2TAF3 TaxID=3233014 RepID=UPI003F9782F3